MCNYRCIFTKVNKKLRHSLLKLFRLKFLILISGFFIFMSLKFNSYGQDYGNDFPAEGTNFIMARCKVSPDKKVGIRELGSKVWDLSGFLPTSFDTIRIKKPIKTTYGRRFPESNVAMVMSPVDIEYLVVDSGKVYLIGLVSDFMEKKLPILLRFQDSLLYRNPHLGMDELYTDNIGTTFIAPYYSHPSDDSIRADISYTRSGRIDARGTLITPLGKYEVEREVVFIEKIVKGYKYTIFGWTPAPEYSLNKHYTFYRWYSKDLKIPLAEAYLNEEDFVEYVTYQYDSPLRLSFTGDHVRCKGGSDGTIHLKVTGGIPDYNYEWSNGGNTADLTDLKAGTYNVTVKDNRNRKISTFYTVAEPHFELEPKLEVKNVSCRGLKNGQVKLSVSGGTAPYNFKWSNDSVNETIRNLSPGLIHLYLIDAGGCYIHDSVEITQPDEKLSLRFKEEIVSCYNGKDGSAIVEANGGTAPYSYLWTDGDTSHFRRNMKAGQYQLSVYDKNKCEVSGSVTIKQAESPIKISKGISPVSCFGETNGSIELSISGGMAPYHCTWKDSSETKSLKGIGCGSYPFIVRDRYGCEVRDSAFVPQPSDSLMVHFVKKDVSCFGESTGEIQLNVAGGTGPYGYTWSDGSTKSTLSKLKRGNYSVRVKDKNECMAKESIEVFEPEKALSVDFEKSDVKCNGGYDGMISLTVDGGTPGYNYVWSNKSVKKDVSGLKAGSYSVTISDMNNCKLKREYEILEPKERIEINIQKTDVDCHGAKSGAIYTDVKGGKSGYDFKWSNDATSANVLGLGAGKYTLELTDNALCNVTKIIELNEPEKLGVKAEIVQPDKEKENGSLKIIISGGTKPYHILWDNGKSTDLIENLRSGNYEVQITDVKDCKISEVFELKEK
jgi:hypothetical protein